MPGIVGILGRGAPDEYQRLVGTMIRTMMHERSYVSGTHFDHDVGVYAGWVAHSGSFAARQSTLRDGSATVLLSGECFGYPSDGGKTLRKSYEQHGEDFAAKLDGPFSGLLTDPRRHLAFLFNDRFGAERIYYHETDAAIYFASEAKALLGVLPQLRRFDDEGVAQFLTYGGTLLDRTLFQGIRVMPPGSIWTADGSVPLKKRLYFHPEEWRALPELTVDRFRESLAESVRATVQAVVGSDSHVGISITGGLDTRMIMACLPRAKYSPVCYTFAGTDGETLDVRLGRRVAQACGLQHRTLRIGPDFLANYGELVDRTTYITDGCASALGAHEIYLNALARQVSPVRVTGNFGSEILRGMSTFKPIKLSTEFLNPGLRARIGVLRSSAPVRERHPVIFAAFNEIPAIHFGIPAAARSQLTFRAPFLSNMIVELAVRSPPGERLSSVACAALIERFDPALSEIPTDRGISPKVAGPSRFWNRVLSEVTFKLDYWHKEGLPKSLRRLEPVLQLLSRAGLLGLHKYLPYRLWFRRELSEYVASVLSDASTQRLPWWNGQSLDRILADHRSGRQNRIREIEAILTLESVHRGLVKKAPVAAGGEAEGRSN